MVISSLRPSHLSQLLRHSCSTKSCKTLTEVGKLRCLKAKPTFCWQESRREPEIWGFWNGDPFSWLFVNWSGCTELRTDSKEKGRRSGGLCTVTWPSSSGEGPHSSGWNAAAEGWVWGAHPIPWMLCRSGDLHLKRWKIVDHWKADQPFLGLLWFMKEDVICDCPSPEPTGSRSVLESTQKLICLSESQTYLVCSHVLYLLLHLFGALCQ